MQSSTLRTYAYVVHYYGSTSSCLSRIKLVINLARSLYVLTSPYRRIGFHAVPYQGLFPLKLLIYALSVTTL